MDDGAIISDAGRLLDDVVISISLARGTVESGVRWLGEWDCSGALTRWTARGSAPDGRARGGGRPFLAYRSLG
jgi:hypothetical protein